MRVVCWDSETFLIAPGMQAPKMVCGSFAEYKDGQLEAEILGVNESIAKLEGLLRSDVLIIGQHIVFDWGVLCAEAPHLVPLVFKAYENGRVGCTKIREQLINIARGELKVRRTKHDLATLAERWLGRFLPKADTWRLRYSELADVPLDQWPEEAVRYPLDDAKTALEVWFAQGRFIEAAFGALADEEGQNRAAWALYLMSVYGIRTDGKATAELKARLEEQCGKAMAHLKAAGIVKTKGSRKNPKDVKDQGEIKRRIEEAFALRGEVPSTTETGATKMNEETLRETGDPDLIVLADNMTAMKLLSTYVPVLEQGASVPVCPRYNVLVDTGRTSCAQPNLQNPPTFGGIRECFVARKGSVFVGADYNTAELRSFSQVCLSMFGFSKFAEVFRSEEDDPHLKFAADLAAVSYLEAKEKLAQGDEEIKRLRKLAKEFNFGKIGGMGNPKFVVHAARRGVFLTLEEAKLYDRRWRENFPEVVPYLEYMSRMANSGDGVMVHHGSNRIRGGVGYTDGANGMFQGLTADGSKHALWLISQECYTNRRSALFGSRPLVFMHDEIILEAPEDRFSEAADRMVELMKEGMAKYTPDIPVKCSPWAARRWFKEAQEVRDAEGKLKVWCTDGV